MYFMDEVDLVDQVEVVHLAAEANGDAREYGTADLYKPLESRSGICMPSPLAMRSVYQVQIVHRTDLSTNSKACLTADELPTG